MREAEENIKFKMEIDVLVPIPRTVTRGFTSLKHLRQCHFVSAIDGSLYCFAHRKYLLNEKGEWEHRYRQTDSDHRRIGKASFGNEAKGVQPIHP